MNQLVLKRISPVRISAYLQQNGWTEKRVAIGVASIWGKTFPKKEVTILLPLDREFVDYPIKLEELVSTVAKFEQITTDSLWTIFCD
jgi:hypothetical protein